jgi:8-oxo-dGTP diphosphatase
VGLLRDPSGRVLVSQRAADAHLGGLWEFPGGKCDADESVGAALRREWWEELGVRVLAATEILTLRYRYPDRSVRLHAFRVERWAGCAESREGQALRWVGRDELTALPFPAASRAIVTAARLPAIYLISPDPGAHSEIARCVGRVDQALGRGGLGLIQVRAPSLGRQAFLQYARGLIEVAAAHAADVLVNAPQDWLEALPPAGWHLTERRLNALSYRPDREGWLAASVHDRRSLERAMALPVDFVVLGPVRPTQTHPGATPLGMAGFAGLCVNAGCPVFALGGMIPSDLHAVRALGAQGIAAIRGILND